MIKRIFFDLDECLLHTIIGDQPEQDCFSFRLDLDGPMYHTIFRPEALPLLSYARDLVGHDNVYVLTTSVRDYAHTIIDAGGFNFEKDQIFTREDIESHYWPTAYGGGIYGKCEKIADENNVLIDNLPPRHNEKKSIFIGIRDMNRYIEVHDYYGVNFPNDKFSNNIKERLKELA